MKIFQSSIKSDVVEGLNKRYFAKNGVYKKLNILLSYGVSGDEDKFLAKPTGLINSIILDSGAWSLNNRKSNNGMEITLKGYELYLKIFGDMFECYFNFDENFTPEGCLENLRNLTKLEESGLKPIPVIHDYYEDEIDYYIDKGYDMVALGSIFNAEKRKQERKYDDVKLAVNNLIKKKFDIKIHVFASSSYEVLSKLPVYSSDSSNWAQNVKYGYIPYWNEGKTDNIYFEDYLDDEKPNRIYFKKYCFRKELEEYLDKQLGMTYDDLMGNNNQLNRQIVNSLYYIEIEEKVTQEHKRQGFLY
ncbi:MAG: hypothetical protein HQK76_18435 [Desulfobacterales bacterium]|nr:hypothetical protein [Desulfobacterales bacterium]